MTVNPAYRYGGAGEVRLSPVFGNHIYVQHVQPSARESNSFNQQLKHLHRFYLHILRLLL